MRINWHDDTKATALHSSTPIPANIGRMDMKLGTNWWARQPWSIGSTIDSYVKATASPVLAVVGICQDPSWHERSYEQYCHATKKYMGPFPTIRPRLKSSILPAQSIIQAFFSSTTCTCASNRKSHPAQMNKTQQYLHETTLHPLLENCIFKQNWIDSWKKYNHHIFHINSRP